MTLTAKLRTLWRGLRGGPVTLAYPVSGPGHPTGPAFRGFPRFDPDRCIGCAGCANHCPAREILVFDLCQEVRVIQYLGRRCTFCGRCAEVCPEKAITMTATFQGASDRAGDQRQRLELFMSTCQRCGRCFPAPNPLTELKLRGYRFDDLAQERWIPRARATLHGDPGLDDIPLEPD